MVNHETHEGIPLEPGTVIDDRYRIDRVLSKGGMGAVVAATDLHGDGLVAIKFLLPQYADDERLLARFQREERATARLRSEHVCHVLGSGMTASRAHYLVMEYLDGEDLRALVRREGALDPRRAAEYVSQAGRALAEAHALGIVHRDLKPANLFLARLADEREIIKVLDFGVAKFDSPNVSGDHLDVPDADLALGSRHYVAPEQILSPRNVDTLADVWALGAILHFLLAGSPPFAASSPEEATLALLTQPSHPLDAGVPERLAQIVQRCLQKDRAQRYPNVVELVRDLAPFTKQALDSEPPRSTRGYLLRTMDLPPIDPAGLAPPEPRAPALRAQPHPVARAVSESPRGRSQMGEGQAGVQGALTHALAFLLGVVLTMIATNAAKCWMETRSTRAPSATAPSSSSSSGERARAGVWRRPTERASG